MNERKDKQDSENKNLPNQFIAETSMRSFINTFENLVNRLSSENDTRLMVYTITEVAEILKCKERTVRHHLFEARDLKYLKVGREVRILYLDLKKFLENRLIPCVHDQEILP
jgi:excisionase family DNA binding protein